MHYYTMYTYIGTSSVLKPPNVYCVCMYFTLRIIANALTCLQVSTRMVTVSSLNFPS